MPPKKAKVPAVVATPESAAAAAAAAAAASALADKYKQLQQLQQAKAASRAPDAGGSAGAGGADKAKQLEAIAAWKAKQQHQKEAAAAAALAAVASAVVPPLEPPLAESAASAAAPPVKKAASSLAPPPSKSKKRSAAELASADDAAPTLKAELKAELAAPPSDSTAAEPRSDAAREDDKSTPGAVFVSCLPQHIETNDLFNLFEPIGPIDNVRIVPGRRYAFVSFLAPTDAAKRALADACIARFDGYDVGGGALLRCVPAREATNNPDRAWIDHDRLHVGDLYDGRPATVPAGAVAATIAADLKAKRAGIDWGFDDDDDDNNNNNNNANNNATTTNNTDADNGDNK